MAYAATTSIEANRLSNDTQTLLRSKKVCAFLATTVNLFPLTAGVVPIPHRDGVPKRAGGRRRV
jgi:hypothetical protein